MFELTFILRCHSRTKLNYEADAKLKFVYDVHSAHSIYEIIERPL